jgi:PAS domain S-box-containing protein
MRLPPEDSPPPLLDPHTAPSLPTAEERYRAFIHNSTEGIWRVEVEQPVPLSLSEDEQLEAFWNQGYLAEANDAFARMYGFETASELLGARLGDLLIRSDPTNEAYLRAFIRAGYKLSDAESVETDREGNIRHFSNTLTGVIEDGCLIRAWGTQRDITAQKRLEEALRESEERFRAVFEQAAFPIVVFALDGRHIMVNHAAADFLGYTPEELLALPAAEAIHPDQRGMLSEMLPRLLSGEENSITLRRHYCRKDGSERWGLATISVLRDAEGQATRLLATTADITAQTESERRREEAITALRASEEQLRLALASGGMGTWVADIAAGTLTVSEEIPPLYGRPRATMTIPLSEWHTMFPPDDIARVVAVFQAALRGEGEFDVQVRTQWPDGITSRWLATRGLVTRDPQGRPLRAVGYTKDITREKEQEAEREALRERQRQFMRDMVFSLTGGRFQLCLHEGELPELLPRVSEPIELTVPTLRVLRQRLRTVTDDLQFSEERFQDIVTAVGECAMNAATHGGGGVGWIGADQERGAVQIWVMDSGQGIAEEKLPLVLEPGNSTAGTLGHGFWLMLRTCDLIYLLTGPGGTTLVLQQNRVAPTPSWLSY